MYFAGVYLFTVKQKENYTNHANYANYANIGGFNVRQHGFR